MSRTIPPGQLCAGAFTFYEDINWKFLGTFQEKYDLWLKFPEGDHRQKIVIRWMQGNAELAGYYVDSPNEVREDLKVPYAEALRRAQVYIHGDPSVSPGSKKRKAS